MAKSRYPKYGSANPSSVSRPRQSSGLSGVRTQLYGAAKLLGDVSAVQSGNIGPRVMRRMMGKTSSRGMSGFMGKMF
jgi:hypothetical protein